MVLKIKNYINELKSRFILLFFSGTFCFAICYINKEILIFLCVKSSIKQINFYFVTTNVIEIFSIYLKVSANISLFFMIVFCSYHIIIFLAPGLYKHELKILSKISMYSSIIFSIFNIITYNIIFPLFWSFFQSYLPEFSNMKITIQFEPKLVEFFDLFCYTFYLTNCSSLLIISIVSYINLQKNKLEQLKNYKKHFIFFTFVLATILTPPEISNQLILAFNILISFELITIIIVLDVIKSARKKIKTHKN